MQNTESGAKKYLLEGPMSEEENKLRDELALAYRQLCREGKFDAESTQLTIMLEGHQAFLTLPIGMVWSTVVSSDFVLVDFDGNILRHSGRINENTGEPYTHDAGIAAVHGSIHKKLGAQRARAVL